MTSREILHSELGQTIVQSINDKIVLKYKIEAEQSQPVVENLILGNRSLLDMIQQGESENRIFKSKAYKTIQSTARRKVYYQLRQYTQDTRQLESLLDDLDQLPVHTPGVERNALLQQLAATHISSKERMEELDYFYTQLVKIAGPLKSVLDVGCGIQPITFPFSKPDIPLERYLALEKDSKCIRVLESFKKLVQPSVSFEVLQWDIKSGWSAASDFYNQDFDLALMLKLVPVVNRNEVELIDTLLQVPAKKIAVSGSRLAMAKKEDIEYRERKFIQSFIKASQRPILGEFKLKEEFVIVLG